MAVGVHRMAVVPSPQVEAGTHEEQVVHEARLVAVSRVAEDLDSEKARRETWS